MSDFDERLIDALRDANPVDEARLPLPADSPQAQLLYEKITGTPYAGSEHRRSRSWKGLLAFGIAALVAIGSGVAYGSLKPAHVTHSLAVTCYGAPSLDTPVAAVSAGPDGPVATCAAAWAAGRVGHGAVPLLVGCVSPTGIAAVFPSQPGADVCGQLGLAPLPAFQPSTTTRPSTVAGTPTTAPASEVRDAIVAALQTSCLSSDGAKTTIQRISAKAGVDWTVIIPEPFPPDRPCASPSFHDNQAQIVLVGIPRSDVGQSSIP